MGSRLLQSTSISLSVFSWPLHYFPHNRHSGFLFNLHQIMSILCSKPSILRIKTKPLTMAQEAQGIRLVSLCSSSFTLTSFRPD